MLPAAVTLLLLGAALFIRGVIGHCVGNEPRCRKCKYDLTGVESNKCPECGRPWTIESAARGRRFKRNKPIACGLAFLLLSAASFTWSALPAIRNFNYYPYVPFDWLVAAAEKNDRRALAELETRLKSGRIHHHDLRLVIDAALRKEATTLLNLPFWMEALHAGSTMAAMSEAQRDIYMDRLLAFHLKAPKCRRVGERLPIGLRFTSSPHLYGIPVPGTMPLSRQWQYTMLSGEVILRAASDGQSSVGEELRTAIRPDVHPNPIRTAISDAFARIEFSTDALAVGDHEVIAHLRYELFRSYADVGPTSSSPWTREITVTTHVTIEAPDAPPCIAEIETPEIAAELRQHIELLSGALPLHFSMRFPLPCSLAGELYLKDGSRMLPISSGWQSALEDYPQRLPRGPLMPSVSAEAARFIDASSQFSLCYRFEPALALHDPDIEEVFSGNIILATYERDPASPMGGWRCTDCPDPAPQPPTRFSAPNYSALGVGLEKLWSTPTTRPAPTTTLSH